VFAALAFLITWGTGMLVVLSDHAGFVNGAHLVPHPMRIPLPVVFLLLTMGSYGPALAAVIVSALESGRAGPRQLLQQFGKWCVGWRWFAAAGLGPVAIRILAVAIAVGLGQETPARWFAAPRLASLAGMAFGPWGEELGWRGYAQARLQERVGALAASGMVGVTWFVWHYWPAATPAGAPLPALWSDFQTNGAPFLLLLIVESVVVAWLYNSTRGSLPVAWAFHAGVNLGGRTILGNAMTFKYQVALFALAAIIVAALRGPRTLARRPSSE
jgi:membrane protease YdiL (CAAX protease family)